MLSYNLSRLIWIVLLLLACTTTNGLAFNAKARIWTSPGELRKLNMTGKAWAQLKRQAQESIGSPNLSDQNQKHNTSVLAKALVYARCSLESAHPQCRDIPLQSFRKEIVHQIMNAIETENGGTVLALGRELAAYVFAADLVGLPPDKDARFRRWLSGVRHKKLPRRTLIVIHEQRPNNWGTHAGASRIAVALYLGDEADLERSAQVFKGWLGDRTTYAGFKFGGSKKDLSWQCDPALPLGINPKGCVKDGHSIDGVIPDDQRRGGSFAWPPPRENYTYEALQGALVQAVLLHRAGYDAFNWEDRALLRAYQWLHQEADFPAIGDDTWQLPVVDYFYGTRFWNGRDAQPGKNVGWTDWTHGQRGGGQNSSRPTRTVPARKLRKVEAKSR